MFPFFSNRNKKRKRARKKNRGSNGDLLMGENSAKVPAESDRIFVLGASECLQPALSSQEKVWLWRRAQELNKAGQLVRVQLGTSGPSQAWVGGITCCIASLPHSFLDCLSLLQLASIGDHLAAHELVRVRWKVALG